MPPDQVTGIVHVILGGGFQTVSYAHLKAEARKPPTNKPQHKCLRTNEVITFSKVDAILSRTPYADILVIRMIIIQKPIAYTLTLGWLSVLSIKDALNS